jgi:glutathione peroxidase-family protein
MEQLGKRWGNKLEILAFPSREWMYQEYKTDEEIQAFASSKNFPGRLLKLGNVKGDAAPPVWKYLRDITGSSDPSWNFKGKYLVSKTGEVSVPTDLEEDIAKLMEEE